MQRMSPLSRKPMPVCLSILNCFTTASVGTATWATKAQINLSTNMSVCALKTVSTFAGEDQRSQILSGEYRIRT